MKKNNHVVIPNETIKAMVALSFPEKTFASHEVILGGCANLNIKISLTNESKSYILRIYLRDKDAPYREQKIADLIEKTVPIPKVYLIGDCNGYRFAIIEYKSGIALRDLLLQNYEDIWKQAIVDAGKMLGEFNKYTFPKAGLLDSNLVIKSVTPDSLYEFVVNCLNHPKVKDNFSENMVNKIHNAFVIHKKILRANSVYSLVHADYGPENILVDKIDGQWKITAILDWESAYSDNWLIDVSNMLRYAHKMPITFEEAFLLGIKNAGLVLPKQWHITVHLFNLASLLDSFVRHPLNERPKIRQDILELVKYIVT